MHEIYTTDELFENLNGSNNTLGPGEYESCEFVNCDFLNADFQGFIFNNCVFRDCNLSTVKVNKTSFIGVQFKFCKMMGIQFDTCNSLGLSLGFEDCRLDHSVFFKVVLKKTKFHKVQFKQVDFGESNLSHCIFSECDFLGAIFENTNLEAADFRTSYNYQIDPENNRIKKAFFSTSGLHGLLNKYEIKIEP